MIVNTLRRGGETVLSKLGLLQSALPIKKAYFGGQADAFLKSCKGVIHIGAHTGEERILYKRCGLKVLWVEAIPRVFETLQKNIQGYKNQTAANALITDKDGEFYDFKVSNNGASSSIYDFKDHEELWPEVKMSETIRLKSKTLVSLLAEMKLSASDYDALILDVQGAELVVLKGVAPVIKNMRFVQTEAADFELYKGSCTVDMLVSAMADWGFKVQRKDCFASKPGVGSCYDILFERAS